MPSNAISCSVDTVFRSLHDVCNGGFIHNGADHFKDNPLKDPLLALQSLADKNAVARIQHKTDRLTQQTRQISGNIFNTTEENGGYRCEVYFGDTRFSLSQSSGSSDLVILNLQNNEKRTWKNIPFPELQKRVLQQFIELQYAQDYTTANLRGFNLKNIKFRLDGVNFHNTSLSRSDFDAIIAAGGSVVGAQLAEGEDVTHLSLEGIALDHIMAASLIKAGKEIRSVLTSYLATPSDQFSCYHKTAMFKGFLEQKCQPGKPPTDLRGFDLSDVDCKALKLNNKVLGQANLEAIVAGNGDLTGATLAKDVDASKLKLYGVKTDKAMAIQLIAANADKRQVVLAYLNTQRSLKISNIDISGLDSTGIDWRSMNKGDIDLKGIAAPQHAALLEENNKSSHFQHDLIEILTSYSQTVAAIVKRSSTLDVVNNAPQSTFDVHERWIADNVRAYFLDNPKFVETIIKTSAGNCYEMAVLCKLMLDLYLKKTIEALGYPSPNFRSFIDFSVGDTTNHVVVRVELTCPFSNVMNQYIIDPWSNGKAWTFDEGMKYLRNRKPDWFTNQHISFRSIEENRVLIGMKYLNSVRAIFDKFNIKESLDSVIQSNKSKLLG